MVITVIGLGFVGLTTALGLASKGHTVYGIESDNNKRTIISSGKIPFYEPFMQPQLEQLLNKKLFIRSEQSGAVEQSECVFFCVGTPFGTDGSADLGYLKKAISDTMQLISPELHPALAIKSTVPAGTLQNDISPMLEEMGFIPGTSFELVNNPEFLREGFCWKDFIEPDRIVIGASSDKGFEILERVYSGFDAPIVKVSTNTAEFIKYLSNTFLATMISYANEMADFARTLGNIDIIKAFSVLHNDRRWENNTMSSYVYPGCGYGGYCLPKDTNAMLYIGKKYNKNMKILSAVIETNNEIPLRIAEIMVSSVGKNAVAGILGLSFKPFTDDVRDTSAAKIIRKLNEMGYKRILVYDPIAQEEFLKAYPELDVIACGSSDEVVNGSDTVGIVTAWPEFSVYKSNPKVTDFRYMAEK